MRLRRCRFILAVSSAISSSCFHCSFFSCDGHIAVVGAVKHSQQGLWPPSAPDPRGGSVVEPHSARAAAAHRPVSAEPLRVSGHTARV